METRKLLIFYPFSLLFRILTGIRNFLYDKSVLRSEKFRIPVICVGNITVGGTGKTPHTEYITRLLRNDFRVAVLSRGYKRKSSGFRIVTPFSQVIDGGDEPLQISRKFPDVLVAVDRNRSNGIRTILKEYPETDVIIMDDGFQHRSVQPGLSVLLTDYGRLLTRDHLMPYGRLRESAGNRSRAGVIIVTKVPDNMDTKETQLIRGEIAPLTGQKLFFSAIRYGEPGPVFPDMDPKRLNITDYTNCGVLLVTGVASSGPLLTYVQKRFREVIHIDFPDHHYYENADLVKIRDSFNDLRSTSKIILTTEKDSVRLREFKNIDDSLKEVLFFLAVTVSFIGEGESEFDNLILEYVRKNKRGN